MLTGDPSHVELKDEGPSGLAHLIGLVEGHPIAQVFRFATHQIIRDPAVATLEALYAQDTPSDPA